MTNKGCDFFLFLEYGKINQPYLEDGEKIMSMNNWVNWVILGCTVIVILTFILK